MGFYEPPEGIEAPEAPEGPPTTPEGEPIPAPGYGLPAPPGVKGVGRPEERKPPSKPPPKKEPAPPPPKPEPMTPSEALAMEEALPESLDLKTVISYARGILDVPVSPKVRKVVMPVTTIVEGVLQETERKVSLERVKELVGLEGEEQFNRARQLGLIPRDSKYIEGEAGRWSYIPGWSGVIARGKEIAQLSEFKKANTQLPDGNWIDNKQLAEIRKNSPETHRLLTTEGFAATDRVFKANQAAIVKLKDYSAPYSHRWKEGGGVDGSKYLRENPGDTKTLKDAGFTNKQIKEWQEYNDQPWVKETPRERYNKAVVAAGGDLFWRDTRKWDKLFEEHPELRELQKASKPLKETKTPKISLQQFTVNFLAARDLESVPFWDKRHKSIGLLTRLAEAEYARIYGYKKTVESAGIRAASFVFSPARIAYPEVAYSDISAMEWGLGVAQVALIALPGIGLGARAALGVTAAKWVTKGVMATVGGVGTAHTVLNWGRMSNIERVISVGIDTLIIGGAIGSSIKRIIPKTHKAINNTAKIAGKSTPKVKHNWATARAIAQREAIKIRKQRASVDALKKVIDDLAKAKEPLKRKLTWAQRRQNARTKVAKAAREAARAQAKVEALEKRLYQARTAKLPKMTWAQRHRKMLTLASRRNKALKLLEAREKALNKRILELKNAKRKMITWGQRHRKMLTEASKRKKATKLLEAQEKALNKRLAEVRREAKRTRAIEKDVYGIVGPHEGKVYDLLITGKKPVAALSVHEVIHWGVDATPAMIEKLKSLGYHTRKVVFQGQVEIIASKSLKKLKKVIKLEKETTRLERLITTGKATSQTLPQLQKLERQLGRLFGYSKADIRAFMKLNYGLKPRLSWAELRQIRRTATKKRSDSIKIGKESLRVALAKQSAQEKALAKRIMEVKNAKRKMITWAQRHRKMLTLSARRAKVAQRAEARAKALDKRLVQLKGTRIKAEKVELKAHQAILDDIKKARQEQWSRMMRIVKDGKKQARTGINPDVEVEIREALETINRAMQTKDIKLLRAGARRLELAAAYVPKQLGAGMLIERAKLLQTNAKQVLQITEGKGKLTKVEQANVADGIKANDNFISNAERQLRRVKKPERKAAIETAIREARKQTAVKTKLKPLIEVAPEFPKGKYPLVRVKQPKELALAGIRAAPSTTNLIVIRARAQPKEIPVKAFRTMPATQIARRYGVSEEELIWAVAATSPEVRNLLRFYEQQRAEEQEEIKPKFAPSPEPREMPQPKEATKVRVREVVETKPEEAPEIVLAPKFKPTEPVKKPPVTEKKPIFKLALPKKKKIKKELKKKPKRYPIAWKQGFGFWVIFPPYKRKSDAKFMLKPPRGAKVARGIGSAYRTIQSLGGDANIILTLDMGIMDVKIIRPSKKAGRKGTIRFTRDVKRKTKSDISLAGVR